MKPIRVLAACMLTAMLGLLACARIDAERELRNTVQQMAQSIERKELGVFLDALADDFTRESGGFGKQDAKRMLAGLLLRNEKVAVAAFVQDVQIEGERAQVKLRVVAVGGVSSLPERGQGWEFDTAWRREGGQWKVFNAEWRESL